MEVRICPICLKPFKVKSNSKKLTCGCQDCVSTASRMEQAKPWFIAKDVCDALGLTNSRKAVARLDDDEKGVTTSDTLGGPQQMNIVNEFGLYRLILESRKPTAKLFKHWIIHEVLPRLRKMSMYLSIEAAPALPAPTIDRPAQLTLNITPTDQSK